MADVPGDGPSRNIVVFADGTGNSAAKAFKTNVWRLYQALDLTSADQIAVFSDGVGTSQFKPFEIIGLALGFGVKRRVLALYKFLCLNYEPGDRIFAFGFSRGAFTIRVLVGMIASQGLVDFKTEEELDRNALAAYRAYRPKAFGSKLPWVVFARFVRDRAVDLWNEITGSRPYAQVQLQAPAFRSAGEIRIAFVGVWDTVSAYGLPVDELTKAVDKWVWPMTFANRDLLGAVDCARQAFSIDDERRTFFPIPWNEPAPALAAAVRKQIDVPDPRLLQVWFAGCHANVGGGYPDDRLAHIPLCWMIGEAAEQGLQFKKDLVADYWDYASETGRIYDSRSGVSVFYRYHPRDAQDLMERDGKRINHGVKPLVDASVIIRMAKGSDDYAPIALPEHIDVLSPLGERIPFIGLPGKRLAPTSKAKPVDKLPLPIGRERDLADMDEKLREALEKLQENGAGSAEKASKVPASGEGNAAGGGIHPQSRLQRAELMRDTVWWRRGVYYALLSIAVLFLTFPLFAGYVTLDVGGEIGKSASGLIGPIFGLVSGLLPGFAAPWIDAVVNYPPPAAILVALLGILLWVNGVLRTRINDRARAAWNVNAGRSATMLQSSRNDAHRRTSLLGTVSLGAGALAVWLGGNYYTGWAFAAAALGLLGIYLLLTRRGPSPKAVPAPVSLRFARAVRTDPFAIRVYNMLREYVLPAVFLTLSIGLILFAVNKTTFEVADSMGAFCEERKGELPKTEQLTGKVAEFKTSQMCSDTGNWLQEGVRYEVAISIKNKWSDRTLCADTRGVGGGSVTHYFGTLLKRWWAEPYFKPIARVGTYGNDEYVLNPVDPAVANPGVANPAAAVTCPNNELRAEIKPKASGELYVYVNDAVIALPGLNDLFYREDNNHGSAEIIVSKVNVFPCKRSAGSVPPADPVDEKCDEPKGAADGAHASPPAPAPGNTGQQ
ncbi:DUF2235 domain-containing protein [Mesorhizobium sp. 113-3-3]|uniref:DUF2235 domain-containing protein n=1 Tax=Mesorhizobium sp. 113-3-3 TaxID=2744516 RepID=UPI00192838FD|nr:DUF2235 domain-containing protein [Mesorhizobium sp. 113-3-3]BCG79098.1 hypothetical protein MesoLj113b_26400 [Mesorhizobium sp. 113-3-3]